MNFWMKFWIFYCCLGLSKMDLKQFWSKYKFNSGSDNMNCINPYTRIELLNISQKFVLNSSFTITDNVNRSCGISWQYAATSKSLKLRNLLLLSWKVFTSGFSKWLLHFQSNFTRAICTTVLQIKSKDDNFQI